MKSDAEIAEGMMGQARVEPLVVDFANPQKNVSETQVEVHDVFSGRVRINGVLATRSYSFSGMRELFDMRPSRFSTLLPHGQVDHKQVTIGWSGRGDNVDEIKAELDRQEKVLREYVGYSQHEVEGHNQQLLGQLASSVAERRRQLTKLDDLRDRI